MGRETLKKSTEIDDIDKELIRLKIENPSITKTALSEKLGVCRENIINRLDKDSVKKAIIELQKGALDILLEGQTKAARKLIKLLDSSDERIVLKAASEILKGVLSDKIDVNVNTFKDWVDSITKSEETEKELH